ncbi:hypothetical protein HK096_001218, partial [Nowakowskiella sp. JEL0078]
MDRRSPLKDMLIAAGESVVKVGILSYQKYMAFPDEDKHRAFLAIEKCTSVLPLQKEKFQISKNSALDICELNT